MARNNSQPPPRTLKEGLRSYTVDTLKTIAKLSADSRDLPTRKDDLVRFLVRQSSRKGIFDRFSEIEKKALVQTAHAAGGAYNRTRFMARYGGEPFPEKVDYHRRTTLLNLFIINGVMPTDIRERVKTVFPEPEPDVIKVVDTLPREVIQSEKHYNGTDEIAVEIVERSTARESLADFTIVLLLIDSGKMKISSANRFPTGSTMAALAKQLTGGDWYEHPCHGGIRTFAWPLLMQAGGFAAASSTALSLTPAGKKVLNGKLPVHLAIRDTWNAWRTKALIDEFSRISAIKGQKSKGRVLTSAPQRRAAVIQALAQCPEGKWITIQELGRHMRAEDRDFSVTRNSWGLYIGDRNYGALGYEGFDTWEILQERYMKALIMEYAATLGIVDIGYAPPDEVACNFNHLWGTDDLEYLSRYDGLLFFRVNDLGAYVLGRNKKYVPLPPQIRRSLNILPNFDIVVTDIAGLSPADRLFLDAVAKGEGDGIWKISRQTIAGAFETGESAERIRSFLSERSKNDLPQTVEVLLRESQRKIVRFSFEGRSCLLACSDPEIMTLIRLDAKLKQYAMITGDSFVVLLPGKEEPFFKRMRKLGYAVPVVKEILG